MTNLTVGKRLVQNLGSPRSKPGHQVVVYREARAGGKVYYRTLSESEAFRPRWLDRFGASFVGYAVPAGGGLRHRFSEQFDTGAGDDHDIFTLDLTLIYAVVEPALLVDRLSEDPLGALEAEVRSVCQRRASKLRYDDLIDPRLDVADHFLRGGREAVEAGAVPLERFKTFARDFGVQLDQVEVTLFFSASRIGKGREFVEIGRNTRVDLARAHSANEVAAVVAQGVRYRQVLDSMATGLQTVITNLAKDVATVPGLGELVTEVSRARDQLESAIGANPQTLLVENGGAGALHGSAGGHGALGAELRRMLEVVAGLEISAVRRAVLRGRILHLLAEVCVAEHSEPGGLESYVEELGRWCDEIELSGVLTSEEQRRYFRRLSSADAARKALSALVELPGSEEVR